VAELDAESCDLAPFPAAKGNAIWCERLEENASDGIATTLRSFYVVRKAKLVAVVEVPVAAGLLELSGSGTSNADRYWVKLEPRTAPDGSTMSFVDSAEASCETARAKNAEFGGYVPDQAARRAKAIERVCAARGRYGWSGGTVRKTAR
jgi:hypothetical protein